MKHEAHDIGRIFGVLFIGGGAAQLLESCAGYLSGAYQALDLGYILTIAAGIALYKHKSWARVFVLALSYIGMGVCVIGGIIYTANPSSSSLVISMSDRATADSPAPWTIYAALALALACFVVAAYFLNTEKARSEFGAAGSRRRRLIVKHKIPS